MEVPRLGVESELQLPAYTTATAIQDLSHIRNLHLHIIGSFDGSIVFVLGTALSGLEGLGNSFFCCCLFVLLFRAASAAYGSSQARGRIEAYTPATATLDLSHICDLHHSSGQHQILNPLMEYPHGH